ncbi:hypothetical protein G9Q97_08735 [Cyclobacterium sp. GBPx2]|uniref:Uncharacterized protein n=2 Tax=Cyclobacteriaceae TaxID=563798 RepID=A0ABX0H9J4_9BACT|nr:hypothetical protein [Cyclobacterium sp.]NHE56896.1 hypothetical protein [Cyclobacterium plantarum]
MNINQPKKTKKRFIIGSIGMAIIFMAFGSYGSFSPLEVGFYTSIGAAVLWYYLSYYVFKWLLDKGKV